MGFDAKVTISTAVSSDEIDTAKDLFLAQETGAKRDKNICVMVASL